MRYVLQTIAVVACLALTQVQFLGQVADDVALDYELTGRIAPAGKAEKLVVYTATWCPPCKQLSPVLKALKDGQYEIEILDIDTQAVSESYAGVPALFYYRAGKLVKKESGFRSQQQILSVLWKPYYLQD